MYVFKFKTYILQFHKNCSKFVTGTRSQKILCIVCKYIIFSMLFYASLVNTNREIYCIQYKRVSLQFSFFNLHACAKKWTACMQAHENRITTRFLWACMQTELVSLKNMRTWHRISFFDVGAFSTIMSRSFWRGRFFLY